ncbi:hypothetical protein ABE142_01435 [Paenibacillus alvei]|uniref:hypothetical protein n=1 Tax=Paenibacillus alvei TaxID=44250 RepID=UPI003D2925E6
MKIYRKILLTSTAILVSSVFSTMVSASATTPDYSSSATNTAGIEVMNDSSQESTLGIFDPNFKEKAKQQGFDPDTIIAGYYVPFDKSHTSNQAGLQTMSDYYLKNIDMQQITGNVIDRSIGRGPAPLSLTVKRGISTTFSSEISSKLGWNGADIASKLGVSYQQSIEFSKTYGPIEVPKNKTYTIYCAPTYNYYSFEVWEKGWFRDSHIGTYEYREPTGLYFYWQDTTGWGN